MSNARNSSTRLSTVYVWEEIRIENCEPLSRRQLRQTGRHTMIVSREGAGSLITGGREFCLEFGKSFIFPPGIAMELDNSSEYPLSAYVLEFLPVSLRKKRHKTVVSLPEGEYRIVPFARMIESARALFENRHLKEEADQYGNHLLFQEMIHLALKAEEKGRDDDAARAVNRTINYIETSYSLDLSLAQLAEMSSMSTRHYSRLFRKMTGKSPIEYLIEQRLNRAKRLLLTSGDSIQEIAASTGFRDPFHFSRSFKRYTSVSPRVYVHLRKENIRVAAMQYLGEMLALGVKPAGAPEKLLAGGYFRGMTEGIARIGNSVVQPDLASLTELKPDVILTFDGHHYEDYAKIAPSLSVPWSMPFFERFRYIAEWIGRSREAEKWIADYSERLERTREIAEKKLGGATASFFWTRGLPRNFQVYYDMPILYRDLKLASPSIVSSVRTKGGYPFKEDIPLKEIRRYSGDHLFVVVSDDPDSVRDMRSLNESPIWRDLPAVKKNQVYSLTTDWLMEDPISLSGQLVDVARMLGLSQADR
ncbi:AraC family transcriptional regulator [Cohnella terricola]|uniref:AraC family transcriptional regulator n=1 Tax=Cohnella terricola TaxID=1289167 RepID=UPI0016447E8F|nr:AraC family transcriptional regulator [Cohnella terricola]